MACMSSHTFCHCLKTQFRAGLQFPNQLTQVPLIRPLVDTAH